MIKLRSKLCFLLGHFWDERVLVYGEEHKACCVYCGKQIPA